MNITLQSSTSSLEIHQTVALSVFVSELVPFPHVSTLGNSFWVRPQSANINIQTVSAYSGLVRKQHREFTLIVGGNILVPLPTSRP